MNVGEFVSEHKVPLALGAGGIVLFLVLRNRGAPAIAATAPIAGAPTPQVALPAAAQDYGVSGQQASALQEKMQQQDLNERAAASNLALMGAQQNLQFQGQQQQQEIQLGAEQLHQQQEVTYGLYKANRPKGAGGIVGAFQRLTGLTPQVAQQYTQAAAQVYGFEQTVTQPKAKPAQGLGGQYPAAGQLYGGRF